MGDELSGYRLVGSADGETPPAPRASRLQWVLLFALTMTAGAVLAYKVGYRVVMQPSPAGGAVASPAVVSNSTTFSGRPRRSKRWKVPMSMGRMGTSSSFVLRSRRRAIKNHAAKAATRSVVLIGSHFGLGNELLKRVFGELCQRPRLSLRCEPTWGGAHDLKSLAAVKGKRRRIVWLESDATQLLRTLRGVRAHASDFRFVHLLWDPLEACLAQWRHLPPPPDEATEPPRRALQVASNSSFSAACDGLRLDALPALYKRATHAKRYRGRSVQLRLEELVGRKSGPTTWRQLFKFLELPDKSSSELVSIGERARPRPRSLFEPRTRIRTRTPTLILPLPPRPHPGMRAVADLELRRRVLNRQLPVWVRERWQHEVVDHNASLLASLRRVRRDLEYHRAAPSHSGSVLEALGDRV